LIQRRAASILVSSPAFVAEVTTPESNMATEPKESLTATLELPALPLRDVVVYPHMVIPLFVGRDKSMKALEAAMEGDSRILLVAQKQPETDDPGEADLHAVGTIGSVLQLVKLPDGTVKVLVEGQSRGQLQSCFETDGMLRAHVVPLQPVFDRPAVELETAARMLVNLFEQLVRQSRKLPPEVLTGLSGIDDLSRLADSIATHLSVRLSDKQKVLDTLAVGARTEMLVGLVESELDLQQVEKRIRGRIKNQMEKSQREYYLNEQMKAIQKELGDMEEGGNEIDALAKKIDDAGMPKEVFAKAKAEFNKLKHMPPMSAEGTVVRNYLDWLTGVPWKKRSKVRKDLRMAEQVLDEDHYGLEKVKERILEYLAVQQRVNKIKGPILCLVGRRASARRRWAIRSRARPTASSCARAWAACATRPRSAVTAAPTSVRCRAASSRTCPRSGQKTRCSCWTRSTRWRWISAVIRRRRCLKCSTPNRTTPSTIITSKSISICPRSCGSPPPTR